MIYWSDADLAFVKIAKKRAEDEGIRFNFIRWAHHPSWFTSDRKYLLIICTLTRLLLRSLIASVNSDVVVFGTNACRMIFGFSFLFNKLFLVYNEIPKENQSVWLEKLDQYICKNTRWLYVSSNERAEHLFKRFSLRSMPMVLYNTTINKWDDTIYTDRLDALIYVGGITGKRFTQDARDNLANLGLPVHVYGPKQDPKVNYLQEPFKYCGILSSEELIWEMRKFRYGLVSYYCNEINYELCAPIKIYEYIAAGCLVISVNKNKGLEKYFNDYPNLFVYLDCFEIQKHFDQKSMNLERDHFLSAAFENNVQFANQIFK